MDEVAKAVEECARAAKLAAPSLAKATEEAVDAALRGMADRLQRTARRCSPPTRPTSPGAEDGMSAGLLDRLRLDPSASTAWPSSCGCSPSAPPPGAVRRVSRPGRRAAAEERRRPVGVIGANYEARPNVTVDVASQLVKSRNAGRAAHRLGGARLGHRAAWTR